MVDFMVLSIFVVLIIVGFDSGGGVGIQVDLCIFVFYCVYGISVLICIIVQNILGVNRFDVLLLEVVKV